MRCPPKHAAEAIVGRDDELEAVSRFLDGVPDGAAALVLEGDRGAGKTHLLNAALAAARERSFRVLHCRPAESEVQLPFTALGDLLDGVVEDVLPSLPRPQRRALEGALLRTDVGAPIDERAVSLAVLAAFRAAAQAGPAVIAVDDIQWLDRSSGRVLEFALRRLDSEPAGVLLVAPARDGSVASPDLRRLAPEGRARRLPVGPLEVDAVGWLVRSQLGASWPRSALLHLHRSTGGNPFFALELARAMLAAGTHPRPGRPMPIPGSLRELVGEYLALLPPEGAEVVLAVAVLSQPTVALVEAAIGRRNRRADGLATATQAGVVRIEGERVRLCRPLLGAVVYADASAEERRWLHGRLAEIVPDPEERTRHLALSMAGPDPTVAGALDRAAASAYGRGATGAAAELGEMAAEYTPVDRPDEVRRRDVEAARYHLEAGNTARARSLLDQVVGGMAAGTARADALRRLAEVHWYEGGGSADELLTQALVEAGEEAWLRAAIERDLAWACLRRGDLRAGSVHAGSAMALGAGLADKELRGEFLATLAFAEAVQGRNGHLQALELAAESEGRTERPGIHSHPVLLVGVLLKWADRFELARRRLEAMHRRAIVRGDELCLPFLLLQLSELECWAGNLDLAASYAATLSEVVARTGQESFRPGALYASALVAVHQGKAELAGEAAVEGARLAERSGEFLFVMQNRAVLGFLELSLGNPELARRQLQRVTEVATATGLQEPGAIRFLADAVEALVAVEELEEAGRLLEQLEERGRALDRAWALATAGRCRGLLLAATGDLDGARVSLQSALQAHQRLPQPFELARTLLALGMIERRSRHKQAARKAMASALRILEELGATLWCERVRVELGRGGFAENGSNGSDRWHSNGPNGSNGSDGSNGLTPTEHRVSALAVEGLTNQEIARALFMGRKTVETHLSSVYRKLGVRSRVELARRLLAEQASQPVT